jgi:hypothetical protein
MQDLASLLEGKKQAGNLFTTHPTHIRNTKFFTGKIIEN